MEEEHKCCNGEGSDCNDKEDCCENVEELSAEDVIEDNHYVLHALIDLLIEKNIITEDELDKKLEEFEAEEESDEMDEASQAEKLADDSGESRVSDEEE